MDKVLYVSVGIPGCGKSTWWEHGKQSGKIPQDAVRINMDTIRKDLTGDESDQSRNAEVARVAQMNLKAALSRGVNAIYWDNTSAKRRYRRDLIKEAKKAGYRTVAIHFDIPFEVCLDRNQNRERVVPVEVLESMHKSIGDGPDYDEGWDEILQVKYE